jgi:hypothetical protein
MLLETAKRPPSEVKKLLACETPISGIALTLIGNRCWQLRKNHCSRIFLPLRDDVKRGKHNTTLLVGKGQLSAGL